MLISKTLDEEEIYSLPPLPGNALPHVETQEEISSQLSKVLRHLCHNVLGRCTSFATAKKTFLAVWASCWIHLSTTETLSSELGHRFRQPHFMYPDEWFLCLLHFPEILFKTLIMIYLLSSLAPHVHLTWHGSYPWTEALFVWTSRKSSVTDPPWSPA